MNFPGSTSYPHFTKMGGVKVFNGKKLRAAMVMADKSVKDICEVLKINPSTFYRKMEKDGDFTRDEISILVRELNIEDPADIFFA